MLTHVRSLMSRAVFQARLVAAGVLLLLSTFAVRQASAQQWVSAITRADYLPNLYSSPTPTADGCQERDANAVSVNVATICSPRVGGLGSGSASYVNGVLRTDARVFATLLNLAPGGSPGDQIVVGSRVDYFDRLTITAPINLSVTRYRFNIGWSGTLTEPTDLAPGVVPFVQGALLFRGSGGPTTPIGWTGITRWFSAFPEVVEEFGGSFAGAFTQNADGNRLITNIFGVSTFEGMLTSNTLDFNFTHYSDAILTNFGATSQVVSGDVRSNFTNSARIAGLQLFDGDRDVTNLVTVSFASGYQLPMEVPEPSTGVLITLGLFMVVGRTWRGRRSVAYRSLPCRTSTEVGIAPSAAATS